MLGKQAKILGRQRQSYDVSFLSNVRLYSFLGERRLSRTRQRFHRQLRGPELPSTDPRRVGGVATPVDYVAARHTAKTCGEAGLTTGSPAHDARKAAGPLK